MPPKKKFKEITDLGLAQCMQAIFENSQRSHANHEKNIHEMCTIQTGKPADAFNAIFESLVNNVLIHFKREPAIERCIEFIVKFATSCGDSFFLNHFIYYLLSISGAKDKAVRFRVTQMISKLLNSLDDDAELEDDLYTSMQKLMIIRIGDKVPLIRIHAMMAVSRLQVNA